MDIDSEFDRLISEGQNDPAVTRDRQIAALLAHARRTNRHMTEVHVALGEFREVLRDLKGAAERQQIELSQNTQITTSVRDAITAGKVATLIIKWLGGIALAFASVYGFIVAIKTGKVP